MISPRKIFEDEKREAIIEKIRKEWMASNSGVPTKVNLYDCMWGKLRSHPSSGKIMREVNYEFPFIKSFSDCFEYTLNLVIEYYFS